MKFGLIPELVGRIPAIVTLDDLDKEALVRILREPKNSITKQYEKLFEMDGVKLTLEDGALEAIAALAIERNTGARGLRSIMEKLMMPLMYAIPSRDDLVELIITPECVTDKAEPKYVTKELVLMESSAKISGALE